MLENPSTRSHLPETVLRLLLGTLATGVGTVYALQADTQRSS
ncbi:hypothetical protein ACFV14_27190 [Streptomyces zaomyceticus]